MQGFWGVESTRLPPARPFSTNTSPVGRHHTPRPCCLETIAVLFTECWPYPGTCVHGLIHPNPSTGPSTPT